jgi:hypothetical protein
LLGHEQLNVRRQPTQLRRTTTGLLDDSLGELVSTTCAPMAAEWWVASLE